MIPLSPQNGENYQFLDKPSKATPGEPGTVLVAPLRERCGGLGEAAEPVPRTRPGLQACAVTRGWTNLGCSPWSGDPREVSTVRRGIDRVDRQYLLHKVEMSNTI